MTDEEQKIRDYIIECVNRSSFSDEDMEEVIIPLIKKAGYKSPEEQEKWQADFTDKIATKYEKRVAEIEVKVEEAKE